MADAASAPARDDRCADAFARAVAMQLDGDGERRVDALLRAAASGEDAGAAALLGDDALLAAAYSNLDLLPHRCAAGDRVAAALRAALERL
jgi:hypothetical protein